MGNVPSNDYWGSQIPHLFDYGKHGRLNLRSIKLFADGMAHCGHHSIQYWYYCLTSILLGALGSWGAALLAPYSDKPETSGILTTPPDVLSNFTRQFRKDGLQVVRFPSHLLVLPPFSNTGLLRIFTVLATGPIKSFWTFSKRS